MLRAVHALPAHVAGLVPRPEFKLSPLWRADVVKKIQYHQAITLLHGQTPMAIVGSNPIHDHAVQLWAVISCHIHRQPVAFHKMMLQLLNGFQDSNNLRRVQITVRADFLSAQRWAIGLGFEYEGRLKSYLDDGSDAFMYARIK